MTPLIHIDDLHFQYLQNQTKKTWILDGINLDVNEGEFIAILGPNGCGKSTLAKHFNALLLPSDGKVLINGMDTQNRKNLLTIRQTIGMIFQNPDNQIISTIVEEDVAFAPENLGLDQTEIRRRVDEALEAVGMIEYRHHTPFKLSGGQKQRVAIAGILAMRPKCLVLDEPTSMLDPKGRADVIRTIKHLNRQFGITVVLITHNMDEAAQAKRVILLEQGKVIRDNPPQEVFTEISLLEKLHLSVPQVTELCVKLRNRGISVPDQIIDVEACTRSIIAALEEENARR
ncbi:energy-coupling factor transporter ATPase [Sporolactobacillus pectinivorans]|uniref:energy-coupling factor transporter ATPase n=1 Tax=Sporolactobacillus pectinivorans TaxID=1591408 RepID=UPI000C26703E|nr:energy-coupling factor transporter ATPase [Sporolactobacillus pectinivorans]